MIDIILNIILAVCVLGILFIFLLMARNEWVYKVRGKLIDEDWEAYLSLPSYDAMLIKFWVWDVNHFVRRGRNG